MLDKIKSDFRAVFEMDPAATSKVEVLLTYSGFHAIVMHRIAHWFLRMGMPFFARALSQFTKFLTGIEIHPAAKIGGSFVIDHGMGVVVGETTEIGEHVLLFQGVTLGGTGKERGKRHPTLGNYVVVGAGAKILGGITIGDCVKIGANAVVLRSVPPHSTVVGVPGKIVRLHGERIEDEMLDHLHMPDPVNEALIKMQKQIARLEQKLEGHPVPQAGQVQVPQSSGGRKHEQKKRAHGGGQGPSRQGLPGVEMPVETVQERQARMAKMEKDERMKLLAIRRTRELSEAQEGQEGEIKAEEQQAPAPKKRARRRRRVRKPGQGGQSGTGEAQGGGEAVPAGAAVSEGGKEEAEPQFNQAEI